MIHGVLDRVENVARISLGDNYQRTHRCPQDKVLSMDILLKFHGIYRSLHSKATPVHTTAPKAVL